MASVTVFKNGEKRNFCQAINFLLTGLRIYTCESKAPFGRALRRAVGFVFARIDMQAN